jgi:biopolymer transport protein ExbD
VLATSALALAATLGCAHSVYRPAQNAGFELEPATEITDQDVAKAFGAKPQLPARVSVAYYVFDDADAEGIERMLSTVPQVTKTYRIPTLLVTGKRRFDEPEWRMHVAPQRQPLSIKKLRLLAARAGADVLLIFDYGHRIQYTPNGLVAFSILLLPTLFLPIQDVETESYLDTYAIDTRNGYLYGQVTASREAGEDYLLIYSSRGTELVDAHRGELVAEAGRLLAQLLTTTATVAVPPPPPPVATPPPTSTIRISFAPDGAVLVNGQRTGTLEAARQRIAELARAGAKEVEVEGRAGVPYERVQRLLDMVREANIGSVAFTPPADPGVTSGAPPPPAAPDPSAAPNPSSGSPDQVTPTPIYPPAGSAQPVSPYLDDRK